MTWHSYVTRNAHGRYPAGSVSRVRVSPCDWRVAELEFEDGEIIGLLRASWRFPGTPIHGAESVESQLLRVIDAAVALDVDDAVMGTG